MTKGDGPHSTVTRHMTMIMGVEMKNMIHAPLHVHASSKEQSESHPYHHMRCGKEMHPF